MVTVSPNQIIIIFYFIHSFQCRNQTYPTRTASSTIWPSNGMLRTMDKLLLFDILDVFLKFNQYFVFKFRFFLFPLINFLDLFFLNYCIRNLQFKNL